MGSLLGSLLVKIAGDDKDLNKAIDGAEKKTKKFSKFLVSAAGLGAGIVAFRALSNAARDLIKIYGVQEIAETKLRAAIKATGKESSISTDNLFDYASELQQITTYGDEVTISAIAMLQQLGDLNEEGLKETIPLVQDFAAAMGVDLQTAASLVGKTIGSSTNALSRYGLEVDMTGTKAEKLTSLTEAMREKFGGMASELAQTGTGALQQYSNAIGDLKEVWGEVILSGMQPFVRGLTTVISEMAAAKREAIDTEKAYKALKELGEGEELASDKQLLLLKDQVKILGQVAASYEGLDENANAAFEAAELKLAQYKKALETEAYWNKEATRLAEEGKTADAEAARIKAENAAALVTWTDKVNAKYGETEEAKKAIFDQEIAWYEYWLPRSQVHKEHIQTILGMLYEQRDAQIDLNEVNTEANDILAEAQIQYDLLKDIIQQKIDADKKEEEAHKKKVESMKEMATYISGPFVDAYSTAFEAFGESLVEGGNALQIFRDAFKETIAGMLEMLAKWLVVKAIEYAIPWPNPFFNPLAAGASLLGAAAASAGAGYVRALSKGGDFIVPPGYPNDSYPMLAESGERVQVTKKEEVERGSTGTIVSAPLILNVNGEPIYRGLLQATRNRIALIDEGAVVT